MFIGFKHDPQKEKHAHKKPWIERHAALQLSSKGNKVNPDLSAYYN